MTQSRLDVEQDAQSADLPEINSLVLVRADGSDVVGTVTGYEMKDGKPIFEYLGSHRLSDGRFSQPSPRWAWPEQVIQPQPNQPKFRDPQKVYGTGSDDTFWNSQVIREGERFDVRVWDANGDRRADREGSVADMALAVSLAEIAVSRFSGRVVPVVSAIEALASRCKATDAAQIAGRFTELVGMSPERFAAEVEGTHSQKLVEKLAARFSGPVGVLMLGELIGWADSFSDQANAVKLAERTEPATTMAEYRALLERWRAADGTAKSSDVTDAIRAAAITEVEAVAEALRMSPFGLDAEGRFAERNLERENNRGAIGIHDWVIGEKCEEGFAVFVDDRQLSYRSDPEKARKYALGIIDRLIADGDYRLNDKPAGWLPPHLPGCDSEGKMLSSSIVPYAAGSAIVAARQLQLDTKCTEPVWDRAQADVFLQSINGSLAKMGVSAQIVGSVAIAGRSWKDLDVLLIPNPGTVMTTSMALQAIEDHLMQEISDCKNTNPVDTSWPEEAWFASLYLRDGRLVEFYLPERFFPNVESLADLPSGGDYPRPRM